MRSIVALLIGLTACSGTQGSSESPSRETETTSDAAPPSTTVPSDQPTDTADTAQPTEAQSKPAGGPGGEMGIVLDEHNRYRAAHCAPPLQWSPELAKVAQKWADTLAKKGCILEHSQSKLGENLAGGTASVMGPDRAAAMWYEESKAHDYSKTGFSMGSGHFTQLVWKGSEKLGCGTVTCKDKRIWVCNYDPPGNMEGAFRKNVQPTTCKK
ncbi:MAG: hypothetical protein HOW73_05300 [Polyangiaceae bacterium]|nr:hypothetical protein [Polyangiaceae bacterium]